MRLSKVNLLEEVYKKLQKHDDSNQHIYDRAHNVITLKAANKGIKKQAVVKHDDSITSIIIVLLIMIFNYIFVWFSKELFVYIWITLGLPILVIMIGDLLAFLHILKLIQADRKKLANWIPLFIFILIIILFIVFPPHETREYYEYKKYYNKRTEVVDMIKNGSLESSEHKEVLLPNNYKKISDFGEIYVYLNNERETLIGFWINKSFPDGGNEIVYSSNGEKLIKENIGSIRKIEKRNNNWYFIAHE